MSESYVSASSNEPAADQSGKVDTAKQEASELKDTAASGAKQVVGTAKEEAKTVASEAKYQVKDLYAQGKRTLADQAGTQQQKVATGLRSVTDELESLASGNGGSGGVASDIVRNVSQRVGTAASFLENRDPADLLDELKSFARRRPAVFLGAATLAGLVVGRLTRALAQNAADDKAADTTDYRAANTSPTYPSDYSNRGTGYAGGLPVDAVDSAPSGVYSTGAAAGGLGVAGAEGLTAEDTPLYTQSTAAWEGDLPGEASGDVRTDSV